MDIDFRFEPLKCISGQVSNLKTDQHYDGSSDGRDFFPTYESEFGLANSPDVIFEFESKRKPVLKNGNDVVVVGQLIHPMRDAEGTSKPRFYCCGYMDMQSGKIRATRFLLPLLGGIFFFFLGINLLMGILMATKKLTKGKSFRRIYSGELNWGRILYASLVGGPWNMVIKSFLARMILYGFIPRQVDPGISGQVIEIQS